MEKNPPSRRLRRRGEEQVSTVRIEVPARTWRGAIWAVAGGALAVWAVLWATEALSGFLFILLTAWLAAVAIEPAIAWFEKRRMSRGWAVGLLASASVIALGAFGFILGKALTDQTGQIAQAAPQTLEQAASWANENLGTHLDVENWAGDLAQGSLEGASILGAVGSGLAALLTIITIIVFACYLAVGAPKIQRTLARRLAPGRQQTLLEVWTLASSKAGGFLISKIVLAALSSLAHCIAFWALGVPYWLPMGIFAGVTSQFIPVVGTYIGIIVPAAFTVFTDPWTALWIVVFATIYQQIENYILTPRIAGASMNLNSGIALAGVIAGAALFGPLGALIGMPLAAIGVALLDAYTHRYDLHPDLHPAPHPRRRKDD